MISTILLTIPYKQKSKFSIRTDCDSCIIMNSMGGSSYWAHCA
jgi:hypothetical protein